MKQFIIILFSFIISSSAYCSDPTTVNFCNNTSNSISIIDLLNCNELTINNPDFTIISVTIGFDVNEDYLEQNITGTSIPQSFLDAVQNNTPDKLYFEEIIIQNGNGETKKIKGYSIKIVG